MTINCKGTLVDLSSPKVMGILNITPDSFFDGGEYQNEVAIIAQVSKMLSEGATFIDVGAYSSKPGAAYVTEEEERKRILHVIQLLVREFPEVLISVDTFRSRIAEETIRAGAAIINDISGGNMDKKMFETVAHLQVPYIVMHMLGTPQNMQKDPQYKNVTHELITFFADKMHRLHQLKVNDVLIDVGFGFGKTKDHNFELLENLSLFQNLEAPILAGISRKSMLYNTLNISAQEALNATTSANTIALLNGANILRVHDVKEAVEAIKIVAQVQSRK